MSSELEREEEGTSAVSGPPPGAPPEGEAGPGDAALLDSLVRSYYPAIMAYARRKLGNPHDAEDVAQETFAKIHQGLSGFTGRSQLTTWLYTVGRNAVTDCLRKRRRSSRVTSWPEDLDRTCGSKEVRSTGPGDDGPLARLVSRLSRDDRRMIFQVYHEDTSLRRLALLAGEPLHRVRRRLRKILEELRATAGDDLR